jgi:signal transduction histidine kinase/class 3 adenylate cyclase
MKVQPGEKPKLLVVDDEPDNLDLLYRTFYREFTVLRAEDAPTALNILATEGDVAVIISDQRMPRMSGTEFLSLTATQYPDTIRIILTGYTDVEDLVEAINSGKVFKYVTKPWDDQELKAVVRQAIDTHNVLKTRTRELRRSLRRESLLNVVTHTIRSAFSYQQILQTIAETVGTRFEASACVVRPFYNGQAEDDWYAYVGSTGIPSLESTQVGHSKADQYHDKQGCISPLVTSTQHLKRILAEALWEAPGVQIIHDVEQDGRFQEGGILAVQGDRYRAADVRASLIVPMFWQKNLVAVLGLHQCGQPRLWQEDEVELLTMVADQAALALSQARAYEQVRALAKREALINTITTTIRSSLDPQEIFAAITQQLGQALHVDGCALSLWTREDEFVQCVGLYDASSPGQMISPERFASTPLESHPLPTSMPQSLVPIEGNPVLQQLLLTQQPVVLNDLEHCPEMRVLEQPLRSPARSLLVVPLILDGEISGSISLRQNKHPRHWLPSEVELAQAVAAQAAIAVHQARLYQTTRQQAEQLLELDRQKTQFFQNISHEFRTPLTLTLGPLETAAANQQDLPYEQVAIALRNCRRLLRLVNQLLDLQRLDAGRMQPSFRPCNLEDFVRQTLEPCQIYCQKKDIQLITRLEACPPVYLDLEKFDKVLYNLLSNAMKFTPQGGSITITLQSTEEHCRLQVSDTGIGIRSDQLPHLFERFRQAEGSANRSYEGSGLGLALAKELVDLHGGQITVDSTYGKGTTFTVWLQTGTGHLPGDRLVEVEAEVEPSRAAIELADMEMEILEEEGDTPTLLSPEASGRAKILFVDDNADLRTYVSGILRERGYHVITARNGSEGFRTAQLHHPDLIITDLMMPRVSGLDLIRMVREVGELRGIPIVLLTAKADEDTRIEGAEQGADAYLAKPFNDRELLAEVHNLLSLKQNERRVAELNTYLTESVLKRFLPPSLVQRAAKGELVLDLRPEPRMVTVLFSDIVGFTQLSNTLRSRKVAELLNEYLTEMTQIIFANGGTIDKFMGDAILVLFGAPEELTPNEQVRRAVTVARQMRRSLQELNHRWAIQGISPVQFRCGIHQGTAVVGMFGGEERADYTAIGPSVNIAARIQAAANPDEILVSAAVADYMEEEDFVKHSPLKLKGVDETVLTFAVKPEPDL